VVKWFRKYKLDFGVFLVLGIPGETIEMMKDSFRYMAKIRYYNPFISVATPYYGTELYEICRKHGYIVKHQPEDLFHIRSFSIKTKEFDKDSVEKTLAWGENYLKIMRYVQNPWLLPPRLFSKAIELITKPFNKKAG